MSVGVMGQKDWEEVEPAQFVPVPADYDYSQSFTFTLADLEDE